jgi:ATP-dependent helicase YprA (DUF1998 family)
MTESFQRINNSRRKRKSVPNGTASTTDVIDLCSDFIQIPPVASTHASANQPDRVTPTHAEPARISHTVAAVPARSRRMSTNDSRNVDDGPSSALDVESPDTSLLPHTYQHILAHFPRVYALASMFWHRGAVCTFLSLSPSLTPLFSFTHLRQMVFLCPTLLQLQPVLLAEEKDDPFAPRKPSVQSLPLPAQYELLSTPLIQKAASAHAGRGGAKPIDGERSVVYIGGERNSISRPRGPKPTPTLIAEAVLQFKRLVVNYFSRPDATLEIPLAPLPPHAPKPHLDQSIGHQSMVPPYSVLKDELTVSVAENTDATTAPRCRESYIRRRPNDGEQMTGLAALLRADPPTTDSDAAGPSSSNNPPNDANSIMDGELIDPFPHITSPLFHNLLAHLKQQQFWKGQIVHVHHIPGRHAITSEIKISDIDERPRPRPLAAISTSNSMLQSDSDEPVYLSQRVVNVLRNLNPPIRSLYLHQSQAINALIPPPGSDIPPCRAVVIATSTSSGKSLCYTLPILESLQKDPNTRALCLFPTKALAQDQLRSLRSFIHTVGGQPSNIVDTYDGDTPNAVRKEVRERVQIMLSNPDMLHCSMLPLHTEFASFFKNLKYVIIDEAHVYHSIFGAHVCLILRRLRRIAKFYGTNPQFICCSATIANPKELTASLIGLKEDEITLVTEDGSAHGEKQFLLYNPPFLSNPSDESSNTAIENEIQHKFQSRTFQFAPFLAQKSIDGKRTSSHMEAAILVANLVQKNYRTICFGNSRKVSEIVSTWIQDILSLTPTTRELIPLVRSYRGGYRPEDRRAIERDLFSGKLRAVISTSALELGIDIGSLDATVHIGFPSTMANLLQQSGRAGRGIRPSLSILIAYPNPLDQFYINNPNKLFSKNAEQCIVDFENPELIIMHIMCAAVELPISPMSDAELFGIRFHSIFHTLVSEKNWLVRRPIDPNISSPFDQIECYELLNGIWEKEFLAKYGNVGSNGRSINTDNGPAACFSIRTANSKNFAIMDISTRSVIDQTEHRRAMFDLHEGAIYSNQGKEYYVEKWDFNSFIIKVRPLHGAGGQSKYYTHCVDRKWTTVTSRILAFTKYETGEEEEEKMNEEQKQQTNHNVEDVQEQVILPSVAAHLATMHAQLSNSSRGSELESEHHPFLRPFRESNRSGGSAAAASHASERHDSAWSVLPYPSMDQWYLKKEEFTTTHLLRWRDLCAYGRVNVTTSVFAFRKISKLTSKVIDKQELNMPSHEFDTYAAWIDIPPSIQRAFQEYVMKEFYEQNSDSNSAAASASSWRGETAVEVAIAKRIKLESGAAAATSSASSSSNANPIPLNNVDRNNLSIRSIHAGIHGLTHCMISLLPIFLLCDGNIHMRCDCPSEFELSYEQRESRPARILMYEGIASTGPAFVHATSKIFHLLLAHAKNVIANCPCTVLQGCPSCTQSSHCSEMNVVTSKKDALWIATAMEQWSREFPLPS